MKMSEVSDKDIEIALSGAGFNGCQTDEGRLMLMELLIKASSGYRNSYTEEAFMSFFGLLKKDRTLNRNGSKFIMSMIYASSNKKAPCYSLIEWFRK